MLKKCTWCKEEKPLEDFRDDSRYKGGKHCYCKKCRPERVTAWRKNNREKLRRSARSSKLRRHYGLTREDYDRLLVKQMGVCAVCKKPETGKSTTGNVKALSVDHNHTTGKIRGLLCGNCNIALGMLKEDPALAISLASYIREHDADK